MDGDPRAAMVGAKFSSAFTVNRTLLLDPHLVDAIDRSNTTATVARTSVHMPTLLSPPAPTDQSIFTNPDDATGRYQLGGFTLASTGVASQRVKWVEFRPDASGYTLEAHITPQPVPAGVVALPPTVPVTTRYLLHATVSGMVREWDFSTIAITGADWTLSLHIDGNAPDMVAQREALYHAMTSSPDAKLVVRRSLTLAIPRTPLRPWPFPRPFGTMVMTRPIALTSAAPPPATMMAHPVALAPHLPLRPLPMPLPHPPFPHPPGPLPHPPTPVPVPVPHPPPPAPLPAPAPVPQVAVSSVTIDSAIPFQFDTTLDQNVFAKLTRDIGTSATGWTHLTSLWQPDPASGVTHDYFVDKSDPRAIYFLPDRFVISRRPDSPHRPCLSVTTLSDATKAAINYVAIPDWNADRVAAATLDLVAQGFVGANHYPLQLFRAGDAVLSLKVPRADPQGGPAFVDQPGASIDTATAIHGSVTVLVDDSTAVINAILEDDSDLFSGSVTVKVDATIVRIPFVARAAEFTGDVCDFTMTTDETAGTITISAVNAIESPVEVDALPITFVRAGAAVPVDATGSLNLPTTLAPGDTFVQTFSCSPSLFPGIVFQADTSKLTVQPDSHALSDVIVDPDVPGTSTRTVTLNVIAAAFAPPATGPALVAVQVEFDGSSSTVSFVAPADPKQTFVTGVAHLTIPLHDFLVGATSQYAYRVHRIYADGTQQVGDPIVDSLDLVYVKVPASGT